MGDGSHRRIEEIKEGESVRATDPATGATGPRRISRVIITEGNKHLNDLTVDTPSGRETLTATHEHPFWSPSENRWVEARDLLSGQTLRSESGAAVEVISNRAHSDTLRTYNFTVEDFHTYYALAGAMPLLVHNSSCGTIALGLAKPDGDEYGLMDFAERHGATYWEQWDMHGKDFEKVVREALDPASDTKIVFNLKGIVDPTDWAKTANVNNPYASDLTAWELAMIRDAPASVQSRVQWFNGIEPAKNPFAATGN
jgi:hypothetical protein